MLLMAASSSADESFASIQNRQVNMSRERPTDLIAILEGEFLKPHSDQAQSLKPTGLY
jgi:hypothetical protein